MSIIVKNTFKILSITTILATLIFSGCKKEEFYFGNMKTPSSLSLATTIQGVSTSNPYGDGSGKVTITLSAGNVINYKVDFGDGQTKMLSSGSYVYKYNNPGTAEYIITVNAVGTGGIVSTTTTKIKVFVAFEIPADILQNLTGGSSKTWICDKEASAHFGVGPIDTFYPDWYAATPNQRDPEVYNDEITFTKGPIGNITMVLDNKGQTFVIGAALPYYGLTGAEGVFAINTSGSKNLVFMGATSASTSANSTRIQFMVPGNGLVNVGLGSNTYEILSLSETNMNLRTIGADGNAWYQKLKVK